MSATEAAVEAARSELGSSFGGQLIGPGDSSYEEERTMFNAMIDKKPSVIAKCSSTGDVASVIGFARTHDLPLAVRGGGHNGGGLGSVDDGVVADLSEMNSVSVDADAKTARVGGGATWAEVDAATNPHGLAVPCGIISTTGVGGLTLGGGIGHLTRGCGLTIDNLLSAQVVLADGQQVTASADENGELYWALRGGGGNFGVVTEFTFRAHPVSDVVGGPTFWAIEQTDELLKAYREFLPTLPRNATGFFCWHTIPPGSAVSRGAAHAQGVRDRLVRRRVGRGGRAGDGADARRGGAAHARCRADAAPGAQQRLRRALRAGRPVVLARRLRQRDPGRVGRCEPGVEREHADLEVGLARLSRSTAPLTTSARATRPGPTATPPGPR